MAARFPFNTNPGKWSRNWWNKATYFYLADFFRRAQFDPNQTAVAGDCIDDYRHRGGASEELSASDWRLPCGGGGGDASNYAFQVFATRELVDGVPTDPPTFSVRILGGPAQVLGGAEVVFADQLEEGVAEGTVIYLRYLMWNEQGEAVSAWADGFQLGPSIPLEAVAPKSLMFGIAAIGTAYTNNVLQYRIGAIQAVALVNASPNADGVNQLEL